MSTISANNVEMKTDFNEITVASAEDYNDAYAFLLTLVDEVPAPINVTENSTDVNIDDLDHRIQYTGEMSKSKINIQQSDNIADDEPADYIPEQPIESLAAHFAMPNCNAINEFYSSRSWPRVFKTKAEMMTKLAKMAKKGTDHQPFMVHTEFPYRHFLLFANDYQFIDYMMARPVNERCFHEVIIGNPRSVVVDIDDNTLDPNEWRKFGSECVTKFVTSFNSYYGEIAHISYDDIIVIDSSGYSHNKQANKFSYQIRTRVYTTTYRENHEFAQWFAASLTRNDVVDFGIYTDYHCMRIPGSTKKDDRRNSHILGDGSRSQPKLPWIDEIHLKDSWIGYNRAKYGVQLPDLMDPEVETKAQAVTTEITDATLNKILTLAAPHTRGYEFRENKGALVLFKRVGVPNKCPICDRTHDSDNGVLYLVIAGNSIMQCCMREKDRIRNHPELIEQRIKIGELAPGEVVSTVAQTKKLSVEDKCQYLIEHPRPKSAHKYVGYDYVEYSKEKMDNYPAAPTLVIHAAKGIGKTEELVRHITNNYDKCRIVALSHRETFAAELSRQLPGFTLYNKITKGRISLYDNPRIIVQMESLCRLDVLEVIDTQMPIDLLIIDESESIIAQLSSPLYKNFNGSWAAFDYLVRYSDNVIALDANVTGRTIDLLRVREEQRKVYVRNDYVRADTKYFITPDSSKWYTQLWTDIGAGKKVVIPTNSATEARAIEHSIRQKYPGKTIRIYTGDTDRKDKFADIADINEKWLVDVLIYSPTITSGVSFKLKHFDRIYGYFRNGSAPAMECDQMLGRVRDIGDKCGYIYIDGRSVECMMNRVQLREQVLTAHNNLFAQYDMTNLVFTYGKDGRRIKNEDYFELWLDNALVTNKSRARFMYEMINIFHNNGAQMELLKIEATATIAAEVAESKEAINQERRMAIELADVILPERAEEIKACIDTTAQERAQLHKYKLAKLYEVPPEQINAAWCKLYDTPDSIRWYKSLRAITTQTLEEIQRADAQQVEKYSDDANLWNMRVHYDRHRIAYEILHICGFNGVRDTSVINKDVIAPSIQKFSAKLDADFAHMQTTFKIRAKKPVFATAPYKVIMGVFNSVLHSQYGIKIITEGKGTAARGNYKIFHYHDFDTVQFRPVVAPPPEETIPVTMSNGIVRNVPISEAAAALGIYMDMRRAQESSEARARTFDDRVAKANEAYEKATTRGKAKALERVTKAREAREKYSNISFVDPNKMRDAFDISGAYADYMAAKTGTGARVDEVIPETNWTTEDEMVLTRMLSGVGHE